MILSTFISRAFAPLTLHFRIKLSLFKAILIFLELIRNTKLIEHQEDTMRTGKKASARTKNSKAKAKTSTTNKTTMNMTLYP